MELTACVNAMDTSTNKLISSRLCRLCAQSEQNVKLTYIFSPNDEDMDDLADIINMFLPVKVSQMDPFPKQVCQDCLERLLFIHEFALSCVAAEQELQMHHQNRFFSVAENTEPAETNQGKPEESDSIVSSAQEGVVLSFVDPVKEKLKAEDPSLSQQEFSCPLCCEGEMGPCTKELFERDVEFDLFDSQTFEEKFMKQYEKANDDIDDDDASADEENMENLEDRAGSNVTYSEKNANNEDTVMFDDVNDEDYNGASIGKMKSTNSFRKSYSSRRGRRRGRGRNRSQAHGGKSQGDGGDGDSLIWIKAEGQQSVPLVQCVQCDGWFPGFASCLQHSLTSHINISGDGEKTYCCARCNSELSSHDDLVAHFTDSHCPGCQFVVEEDDGEIVVKDCGDFESQLAPISNYNCTVCLKSFSTLLNFLRHSCPLVECSNMHCDVCDQIYRNRQRFVFHMNFHSPKAPPLECDVCGVSYTDDSQLYDHVRFAHLNENVICDECGKHFRSEKGLVSHQLSTHCADPAVLNKHKCHICGKGYRDKQGLREHLVTHMSEKPFRCDKCDRAYNRFSRLKQHQMSHLYSERMDCYDCSVCGLAFPIEEKAQQHSVDNQHDVQSVTLNKVLRCEFCDSLFSCPDGLNKHRTSHGGESPYVCHICGASFHTYSRVTTHKTTHGIYDQIEPQEGEFTIPRYFLCEHCGLSYPYWSYLQTHRRMRHSENPYTLSCKLCPEKFKNSWSVVYHRRKVHEKDGSEWRKRSKECPHCGIHCMYQHTLDMHIERKHSSMKDEETRDQYQCEECGKVFKYQSSLALHQKIHKGQKNFICEECNKSFLTMTTLRNHNKRCHEGVKPHQCEFCGKAFFHRGTRDDHLRVHTGEKPFKCQHCERAFRLKSMLTDHLKIHNDHRPYPCDVCGMSFRRMVHMKQHRMLHTGEKPFQCGVCGQDYRLKQELQRHLKTKHGETSTEDIDEEEFVFAE